MMMINVSSAQHKHDKLRIGVIFGGRSGEHAVSLMSAESVLRALDKEKYQVIQIGITREGTWFTGQDVLQAFRQEKFDGLVRAAILPDTTRSGLFRLSDVSPLELLTTLDVVFPVLHGTFGEDGTLQGLLEMADLAYVGPGVLGSALAMDKVAFKDVMRTHNIPVLDYILARRSEIHQDAENLVARIESLGEYPFFTKPANLGSSVGISKCRTRSDLMEGLLEAAKFDRRVLVEVGLPDAREIEVSVLGNNVPEASIPGEIIPAGDFYTYESKYLDDRSRLLIPAPLSEPQAAQVRRLAVQAYRAIDCAGLARVDFLLGQTNDEIYLNEINTIPGFTRISMYPKLWEASGLPYSQLLDRLIALALERKAERDETVRDFTW